MREDRNLVLLLSVLLTGCAGATNGAVSESTAPAGASQEKEAQHYLGSIGLYETDIEALEETEYDATSGYTVYVDENQMLYYFDAQGALRLIINNGAYTSAAAVQGTSDISALAQKLLAEYDLSCDRDGIEEAVEYDGYGYEYVAYQVVNGDQVNLITLHFDQSGNLISGNFELDSYVADAEELLSDEECIRLACEYLEAEVEGYALLMEKETQVEVVLNPHGGVVYKDVTISTAEGIAEGYVVELDAYTGAVFSVDQLK